MLDFLNLSLILIGTVGVNYAQTNSAGTCLVNVYWFKYFDLLNFVNKLFKNDELNTFFGSVCFA